MANLRMMQPGPKMTKVNALLTLLRDIDAARAEAVEELEGQTSQLEKLTEKKLREISNVVTDSLKTEMEERKHRLINCLKVLDEFEKRRQDAITALSAA